MYLYNITSYTNHHNNHVTMYALYPQLNTFVIQKRIKGK